MRFLIPITFLIAAACMPSDAAKDGGNAVMEIDIEAEKYSDQTRDLEDQFKQLIYEDLEGREIDYQSLTDKHIAEVSRELRTKHAAVIAAFDTAFVRDELNAGMPKAEAQERARAYVNDYFQSLWDVQMDPNK